MERTGSLAAGYVIGAALLIPLVLLGLFFAAYVGSLGLLLASAVLATCSLVAWLGRRRADRSARSG